MLAGRARNIAGDYLSQMGKNWGVIKERKEKMASAQQKAADKDLATLNENIKKDKLKIRNNFKKAGLKDDSFFNLMNAQIDRKADLMKHLNYYSKEDKARAQSEIDLIDERIADAAIEIPWVDQRIKQLLAQEVGDDSSDIAPLNTPGGLTTVGNKEWWDRVYALQGKSFDKDGKLLPLVEFNYKKGSNELWATRCLQADAEGKCIGKTDSFNVKQLLEETNEPGSILTIVADQNGTFDSMGIMNKNTGKVNERYREQTIFNETSPDGKTTFDVVPTNYSKIVQDFGGELNKQGSILLDSESAKDINATWFFYGGKTASEYGALPEKNGKIDMESDGAKLFLDMFVEMGLSNNVPLYELDNVQEVIKDVAPREDVSWKDTFSENEKKFSAKQKDTGEYRTPIQSQYTKNEKEVKPKTNTLNTKKVNTLIKDVFKTALTNVQGRKNRIGANAIIDAISKNPRKWGLTGTELEKILSRAKVINPKDKSARNKHGVLGDFDAIEGAKRVLEVIPIISKIYTPQEISDLVEAEIEELTGMTDEQEKKFSSLLSSLKERYQADK